MVQFIVSFEFLAERGADRVIKVFSDEAAGAIKAEAEALAAEERERVAAFRFLKFCL